MTTAVLPVKSFGRAKSPSSASDAGARRGDGRRRARRARRGAGAGRGPRRHARAARHGAAARAVGAASSTTRTRPATAGRAAAASPPRPRRRARAARPRRLPPARPGRGRRAARRPAGPGVTIVPDRHGTGTNALVLAPPAVMEPSFGPGSCARHAALARAAGVRVRVVEVPSLAFDVDTPDDLAALHHGVIEAGALEGCPRSAPATTSPRCWRAADLRPTDVLCVAHKVVSKAEGRVVDLATVEPGDARAGVGGAVGQGPARGAGGARRGRGDRARRRRPADLPHPPRLRLRQRRRRPLQRRRRGPRGPAAAGPRRLRPRAARGARLRGGDHGLLRPAWRVGQAEIAIGCAGLAPLADYRGATDRDGREMHASHIAIADQAACAADLARAKAGGPARGAAARPRGARARRRRPGRGRAGPRARATTCFDRRA